LRVGRAPLYALGPAAHAWTRYPRLVVAGAQKLFITAVMLPLALAGLLVLARDKKWRALVVLLAVPVYYLCVQSALHTEYRYVLAVHYFLFAAAAAALCRAGQKIFDFGFLIFDLRLNQHGRRLPIANRKSKIKNYGE